MIEFADGHLDLIGGFISPEAPVPVLAVTREGYTLGGAGNVVNNLAALGAHVAVAGVIGTAADDLAVRGRVGFVLHYDAQGMEQAGLELNGLAFDDRRGRFGLRSTSGAVAWDRAADVPVSQLSTEGVSLFRIRSDPFDVRARFAGDRVDLHELQR